MRGVERGKGCGIREGIKTKKTQDKRKKDKTTHTNASLCPRDVHTNQSYSKARQRKQRKEKCALCGATAGAGIVHTWRQEARGFQARKRAQRHKQQKAANKKTTTYLSPSLSLFSVSACLSLCPVSCSFVCVSMSVPLCVRSIRYIFVCVYFLLFLSISFSLSLDLSSYTSGPPKCANALSP